jgi:hypothetical protein
MANEAVLSTTVKATLDTKNQTREKVHEALDLILNRGLCTHCGQVAVLSADLDSNQK